MFAVLILSFVVSAITLNNTPVNNISNSAINMSHKLAKIQNEDLLDFDRQYKENYLKQRNNFSNLDFKKIIGKEDLILKIGAKNDKVRGLELNQSRFVVDLILCNPHERYCAFRVNGVPTKKLFSVKDVGVSKPTTMNLDGIHLLKINSINFNFCDNRRFCHLGAEGYHIVNASVERK